VRVALFLGWVARTTSPATVAEHWPGSSGSLRLIFKLAGWSSSGPA
jgi:hypothetical protein